jgi:hypothetical protein
MTFLQTLCDRNQPKMTAFHEWARCDPSEMGSVRKGPWKGSTVIKDEKRGKEEKTA